VSDINDRIDELADGIDDLKTTAEELTDEVSGSRKRHVERVREALDDAVDETDQLEEDSDG